MATLILLFSFHFLSDSFAQDNPSALYDQGKYQQALEILQKNGLRTAADYYNVGNSYYKLGRLGQALAYYKKAHELAPSNEDIEYNLNLTQEQMTKSGVFPQNNAVWSGKIVPFLREIREEWLEGVLFVLGLIVLMTALRVRQKASGVLAFLHPTILTLTFIWSALAIFTGFTFLAKKAPLAAVVSDLAVARSGPNESFTELFKLPAGTTVEVSGESREGWQQIQFQRTKLGWMQEKDLLNL